MTSTAPDGAISREFFHCGNATVMTGQYSPVLGWPARSNAVRGALAVGY